MGLLPIWLAFPITALNVMLSYLPLGEAQHSIVALEGRPLRWLNELVVHISVIPLAQPFRILRDTHFEHHNQTNDPQLDPGYGVHVQSGWALLCKSIQGRRLGLQPNLLQRIVCLRAIWFRTRSRIIVVVIQAKRYDLISTTICQGHLTNLLRRKGDTIPLGLTPAAFRELKPILVKKDVGICC
jgi:hypothetical protein